MLYMKAKSKSSCHNESYSSVMINKGQCYAPGNRTMLRMLKAKFTMLVFY